MDNERDKKRPRTKHPRSPQATPGQPSHTATTAVPSGRLQCGPVTNLVTQMLREQRVIHCQVIDSNKIVCKGQSANCSIAYDNSGHAEPPCCCLRQTRHPHTRAALDALTQKPIDIEENLLHNGNATACVSALANTLNPHCVVFR